MARSGPGARRTAGPSGPRRIGPYEVVEELAQGGMGVVTLARQPSLDRLVVLKHLRRDLDDDPALEDRLRREACTAATLHHPNVVVVYDFFAWRGEHYIAQEYVDGVDLATVLAQAERMEPRVAALVALEVARGLEEIHARGLVHRDLKPGNVLLGRGGEIKITDFGIALDPKGPALTRTGYALGTPPYMSPEQLLGKRVDARSDHFALGVLLHEMCAGAPPFAETDPEGRALVERIDSGPPPLRRAAPDAPRALARMVRTCLRPHPRRRFASTTALRARLERHLGSPSPADCRRELAEWLAARRLLRAARGRTVRSRRSEDEATPRAGAWRRRAALAAALVALALGAGVVHGGIGIGIEGLGLDRLSAAVAGLSPRPPAP